MVPGVRGVAVKAWQLQGNQDEAQGCYAYGESNGKGEWTMKWKLFFFRICEGFHFLFHYLNIAPIYTL